MRRTCSNSVSVVTAKLTEADDLTAAFEGCRGVFHTSALADPAGLSGYSVWLFLSPLFFFFFLIFFGISLVL